MDCGFSISDFGFRIADFRLQSAIRNRESAIDRRDFLSAALLLPAAAALSFAADPLYVLKPNDFERLKLDFNSNRSSVRLLFVLSPT